MRSRVFGSCSIDSSWNRCFPESPVFLHFRLVRVHSFMFKPLPLIPGKAAIGVRYGNGCVLLGEPCSIGNRGRTIAYQTALLGLIVRLEVDNKQPFFYS